MKLVVNAILMRRLAAAAVILFSLSGVEQALGQWETSWLSVGDLHHRYVAGGMQWETYENVMMQWPGIQPQVSYMHGNALWISAEDWTSADGKEYPVRISHIGPRITGIGEFFSQEFALIGQFEAPVTIVDGFETFKRPVVLDEVRQDLEADRMVHIVVNSSVGVTMEKNARQFSNQFHDNYHIIEYTFTNTGNVDGDEEIELPDQELKNVYFTFIRRPKINSPAGSWGNTNGAAAWGGYVLTDIVGNGYHDYGVDWRGYFNWMGHIPSISQYSTIGTPMWVPGSWWYTLQVDTTGRLGGAAMGGTVILHADGKAHAADQQLPDDKSQPRVMTYLNSDDGAITGSNSDENITGMKIEREWIENGAPVRDYPITGSWSGVRTHPAQPYIATSTPEGQEVNFVEHFAQQRNDPSIGGIWWSYSSGFGPYDMAPGEEVHIVIMKGVDGLSQDLSVALGEWYKNNVQTDGVQAANQALFGWNPTTGVRCEQGDEGCVLHTKNEWVMTARDSLFQLIERAQANYASGYQAISPPMPPSRFEVTSGTDKISLEWEPYPGESPAGGWDLYRAQNRFDGIPAPNDKTDYKLIQHFAPNETSYQDTDVARGVSYYYYLQAIGASNPVDPMAITGTPDGVPLKSSRYYAQTYSPAFLKRPPGKTLSDARVVPNPYIIAADQSLRWPDQQDKIGFLDIPGNCTIEIYTEQARLVEVIEHTDGSGDAFWDLTTRSNQVVVSGIYLAVITDNDTGEQLIRKFVIIR